MDDDDNRTLGYGGVEGLEREIANKGLASIRVDVLAQINGLHKEIGVLTERLKTLTTAHVELKEEFEGLEEVHKEESEELSKLKEKMGDPVALHRRMLEVVEKKGFEVHPFVKFGKFYLRDGKQVFYEDLVREVPPKGSRMPRAPRGPSPKKSEKFTFSEVKVKI